MSIDFEELARLESEATPGPWQVERDPGVGYVVASEASWVAVAGDEEGNQEDAALIVAMRNALPELIKQTMHAEEYADVLRAELDAAESRVAHLEAGIKALIANPSVRRWIDDSELVDVEDLRALLNGTDKGGAK